MRTKVLAVLSICASLAFCASSQAKIQKNRGKDPNYQYNLGLFYLNQSNIDEAVKYFVKPCPWTPGSISPGTASASRIP
jgi:outer membrane protein assembly factor BamD (BamD/ComL family)